MKRRLSENAGWIALLLLGVATRFFRISHPADVVWDEQHFGRFAIAYIGGSYFFDIHPPLGKLLIYLPLKLAGGEIPLDFNFNSSTPYPERFPYVVARLVPALFGALTPLLVFLAARALKFAKRTALVAGAFVLLDNALLGIAHHVYIDIFLHSFILLALLLFALHRDAPEGGLRRWILLVAAGAAAGAAVSVKWTGAGIFGVLGALSLWDWWRAGNARLLGLRAAGLALPAALLYVSLFALHFAMLPNTGTGAVFMSERFRVSLRGSEEWRRGKLEPLGFAEKFHELNEEMYLANMRLGKDPEKPHPNQSTPFEWVAGRKNIWFWSKPGDKTGESRIYLLANPVVWFLGTSSLAAGLAFAGLRWRAIRELVGTHPEWAAKAESIALLAWMWICFWAPFLRITRPMFLYHYFTALLASILLGSLLVLELIPAVGWKGAPELKEPPRWLAGALVGAAAAAFLVIAPATYGFPPWFGWQSWLLPKPM